MYTTADDYSDNNLTTGRLNVGGRVTGNIELASDEDWFKIDLTAGITYVFELLGADGGGGTLSSSSGSHQAYLQLYSPINYSTNFMTRINATYNGGIGGDPLMSYTPVLGGIYYLSASDLYGTGTGTYTIKATAVGASYTNQSDASLAVGPPTVSFFIPSDGSINVPTTNNISLLFKENIQCGTGNITLKNAAGLIIETFDAATSTNLSIISNILWIDPTNNLSNNTHYFLTIDPGAIIDIDGNSYAGTTTYDFTTIKNIISGTSVNDALNTTSGDDQIDGAAGIDTVTYNSTRSIYAITKTLTGFTVSGGNDGADILTNIERLKFSDANIALDLDGNAGLTAKILGIVFGAAYMSNKQYVGIGLTLLDGGMSYSDIMQAALNAKLGAGFSNEAEVNLLYHNLIGVLPSAADLNYWTETLSSGQFTQSSLAQMAAEFSLNATNINLIGLQQTGIEYA